MLHIFYHNVTVNKFKCIWNKYENNQKMKINNSSGIYMTVYIGSCLLKTVRFIEDKF